MSKSNSGGVARFVVSAMVLGMASLFGIGAIQLLDEIPRAFHKGTVEGLLEVGLTAFCVAATISLIKLFIRAANGEFDS